MKNLLNVLCLFALTAATFAIAAEPNAATRNQIYRDRLREVAVWRNGLVKMDDANATFHYDIAAKLALGVDLDWCSRRVIQIMQQPQSGDMFWMFPWIEIAYLGRDKLSPEAQGAIREAWRTYMPMRGDTENHWAMYYTSLYLAAELWPNEAGDRWFTGKSSTENLQEARAYLVHWMNLTTTIGQGEYDCTHYIGEYSIPMMQLATFARDPEMKKRGRMMLDYIMADFAADSLNGLYIGAHARTDDTTVLEHWLAFSTFFSWAFFQNVPVPPTYGSGWTIFFAAAGLVSDYELPEVIYHIANDRSQPYLHRELKRTRNRWRESDVRNLPVYKQSYVTKDYALGSDQGGLLQPIQQHSWDVTWAVPDPRGVQNTLFSNHPMWSAEELQMYFAELPDWMPTLVTQQSKPSYMAEDKLLGGSKYEQIFQDRDTLVALYDIAPGTHFEHINGFFSKDLEKLEEDKSGWIFAQGGNAYLAYYPLAPYEWKPIAKGGKRLVSPHLHNGTILHVASASEFPNWDAFKNAIRALPLKVQRDPKPRVELTTLRGRKVICQYGATPLIDGKPVDYAAWPLFGGPFLNAAKDSRTLTLTHGKLKRVLDFNAVTITDSVEK
jgi:hypothetical protein